MEFEFDRLVLDIVNISRMINGRSMKFSKTLSNQNMLKVAKFGVLTFTLFELLKFSALLSKMTLPSGIIFIWNFSANSHRIVATKMPF